MYRDAEFEAEPSSRLRASLPAVFAGLLLATVVGLAGSLIGRNAVAHNSEAASDVAFIAPMTELEGKGSLLPRDAIVAGFNVEVPRPQIVSAESKGDLLDGPLFIVAPNAPALPPPLPKAKPNNIAAIVSHQKSIKITPASYNPNEDEEETPTPAKKAATAAVVPSGPVVLVPPSAVPLPPVASVKPPVVKKAAPSAEERFQNAELTCLARAVYFEARSESTLGQLAVAKVVLNRLHDPNYPKTVCGVVYQGSERRNACQFSFACDGQPDVIRNQDAWEHAKDIAGRAMDDDPAIAHLKAVNYHADYVSPDWSRTMRRVSRIGHHIFYTLRRKEG